MDIQAMYFRDPSKYKYTTDNIIVGRAELHAITTRAGQHGWATLGGGFITDRKAAMKYAERMNGLIQSNTQRIRMAQSPMM